MNFGRERIRNRRELKPPTDAQDWNRRPDDPAAVFGNCNWAAKCCLSPGGDEDLIHSGSSSQLEMADIDAEAGCNQRVDHALD
jgi:hypothetical protein